MAAQFAPACVSSSIPVLQTRKWVRMERSLDPACVLVALRTPLVHVPLYIAAYCAGFVFVDWHFADLVTASTGADLMDRCGHQRT